MGTKLRYLWQDGAQMLRVLWTIPLFGKQTHTCVTMISMCANTWKYQFVGNSNLSHMCSYFWFYLKKMFIAMKTERSLYATWNSKNTRDFIYLSSWSPSAKRGRKLRHKKMSVFPWLCVSQLWSPAQALFYLFYL